MGEIRCTDDFSLVERNNFFRVRLRLQLGVQDLTGFAVNDTRKRTRSAVDAGTEPSIGNTKVHILKIIELSESDWSV